MRLEHSRYSVINTSNAISATATTIDLIEKLLQTPIPDCRKYCMWKIMAPYLINTRKLQYDQAFAIMYNWVQECNKLQRLQFNAKSRIRDNLQSAIKKGYYPIGLRTLEVANKWLYDLVK
jgi:hypothetical protein